MIVEKKDGDRERRLLTALIVDPVVLAAVARRWESPGFFRSQASNLVGGWCVAFHRRYGKAPGPDIEGLFQRWAESGGRDKETVRAVESLLVSLSGRYGRLKKHSQSQYLIDVAGEYFTETKLRDLGAQIDALVRNGDVAKADALAKSYTRVELGTGSHVDVIEDDEAWAEAFAVQSDPVVTYPGAAGVFFRDVLERNGFVAFEGRTGVGKSWVVQDVGWRAVMQGHRVAMFQCGDMSKDQMMMRLGARVARKPVERATVKIPVALEASTGGGFVTPSHRTRRWKTDLSEREVGVARRKLRRKSWYNGPALRLECYPARGVSVYGIKARLDEWARADWSPDVVVIDYADILAPPTGAQVESRDEINTTWLVMRAMSVQYHCLVVTATQVNRAGYDTAVIELKHTSEDRRKMDHVTASVGITATPEEREQGLCRMGWVKPPRKRKVNMQRTLFCAGALELANPVILSSF